MAISINPETVPTQIKSFVTTYSTFANSLKKTNSTFGALNSYWTGERYKKIMQVWNKNVPILNQQLKLLAEASKVLTGIFKQYTTADTKAVSIEAASVQKLDTCTISDSTKINFDDSKLTEDLQEIQTNLNFAITAATSMNNVSKKAEWSDGSGAIDSAKRDINTAVEKITSCLKELLEDNTNALDATKSDFGKARSSYGK